MDRPSGQHRLGIVPENHKLLLHHSSSFAPLGRKGTPMKTLRLGVAFAAIFGVLAPAGAQTLPGGVLAGPLFPQPGSGSLFPGNGSLFPSPMPQQHGRFGGGHGHNHGFGSGGFIIYDDEPEVVHDVVVVHDEAPEPPPPPPPPRQRWVLGRSYDALPGGCLKMLMGAGSYFDCSGEWYRQVGTGFQAVRMP
jgi:hypothetical protein